MAQQKLENKEEIKVKESIILLNACEAVKKAKSMLQEGDFALTQGILRMVFNGLGEFIPNSEYLNGEKKQLLTELNDKVFYIRDDLVRKVEVEMEDLVEAVSSSDAYQRLEKVQTTFKKYLNDWYGSSKS